MTHAQCDTNILAYLDMLWVLGRLPANICLITNIQNPDRSCIRFDTWGPDQARDFLESHGLRIIIPSIEKLSVPEPGEPK